MSKRLLPLLPIALAVALFALAMRSLSRELERTSTADVLAALRSLSAARMAAALALTAVSYTVLSGCDWLALTYLRRGLPWRRVALASFLGYAFSHNLGFAWLSGGSVRYRLYRAWGLHRRQIAVLVLLLGWTFWGGLVARAGVLLLIDPPIAPPALPIARVSIEALGWSCVAATALYLAATRWWRRPVRYRGWALELPATRVALGQLAVANVDWILSGSVLYLLLPPEAAPSLLDFLGVFLLAQIAVALAQVPAGLGVMETVVVVGLAPRVEASAALGALIAYRAVYYLLPLLIAVAALGPYELRLRRRAARATRVRG